MFERELGRPIQGTAEVWLAAFPVVDERQFLGNLIDFPQETSRGGLNGFLGNRFWHIVPCSWFEPKLASQFYVETALRIAGITGPTARNASFSPIWGMSSKQEGSYDDLLYLLPPVLRERG